MTVFQGSERIELPVEHGEAEPEPECDQQAEPEPEAKPDPKRNTRGRASKPRG